ISDFDFFMPDPVLRQRSEARAIRKRDATVALVHLLELSRRKNHHSSTIPTTNHLAGLFSSPTSARTPRPSVSRITWFPEPAPSLSNARTGSASGFLAWFSG